MSCEYEFCNDKNRGGRFFQTPFPLEGGTEESRFFSRLEPGQEMHMECYIDHCVRKSIEEQAKDHV